MNLNEKEKNKNENQLNKNLYFTFISNITKDSYIIRDLDNSFIIFSTINNLFNLVYSNEIKSIISYDLNKFQIITELKNPHEGHYITNFRHFFDKNNKNDLILSISAKNCMIKIWNNKNWDCILSIKDIYQNGIINSACFIFYDKNIFIATCNNLWPKADFINIIDFKGSIIKKINDSDKNAYCIDSYFDKLNSNLYIVTSNYDCVISYNYIKNEIYHKYYDCNSKYHCSFKILEKDETIKLIESAADGIIRIWNFHSGSLIKKIYVSNVCLYGICLWEYDYIFVGCADNNIKLININNGEITKKIEGFKNWVCTIYTIYHIKYGICLIAQSIRDEQIKLWQIKKDK